MLAMFSVGEVLTLNSLIFCAVAAAATMYNQLECTLQSRAITCSDLEPSACCTSSYVRLFSSVQVYNIEPGVDVAWAANANLDYDCVGVVSGDNLACLQTGNPTLLGAFWIDGFADHSINRSTSTTPPLCKFPQIADIYWLALPGKQGEPYSLNVTKSFDKYNAVDMSTHTFKPDKLDVVQEVLSQYGNGLTGIQLATLSM